MRLHRGMMGNMFLLSSMKNRSHKFTQSACEKIKCRKCVFFTNPLLACIMFSGSCCGGQGLGYRQEVVLGIGTRVVWRTARRCRQAAEGRQDLNRTRTRI